MAKQVKLSTMIADKGITATAELGKKPAWDVGGQPHYRVTLRFGKRRMTVDFWTNGSPDVDNVLSSVMLDARAAENARSFEEFASEFGYDEDSREAEKTFKACVATKIRLERFFGDQYDAFMNAENDI